jgi:hypothetical protein
LIVTHHCTHSVLTPWLWPQWRGWSDFSPLLHIQSSIIGQEMQETIQ